jgi:hypothetical protein
MVIVPQIRKVASYQIQTSSSQTSKNNLSIVIMKATFQMKILVILMKILLEILNIKISNKLIKKISSNLQNNLMLQSQPVMVKLRKLLNLN